MVPSSTEGLTFFFQAQSDDISIDCCVRPSNNHGVVANSGAIVTLFSRLHTRRNIVDRLYYNSSTAIIHFRSIVNYV